MEAVIENSPILMSNDSRNYNMLIGFNDILTTISKSKNEDELRKNMAENIGKFRYFKWGFGGNHMWVHQNNIKSDESSKYIDESKRILIVRF